MNNWEMGDEQQPGNRCATRFMSLLMVLLLVVNLHSSVVAQQLTPSSRVSLITYGPGDDDISSSFGHTEIRIIDPALGLDRDYSYGGFDYRADYFILKFLRGTLPYFLSVHNLYQVMYYYQQTNRSIREQQLALSLTQRQKLFAALETNYLPENREYRYKFYYDNCATRPRDMIVEACGDSLTIPSRSRMTGKSYRDWMNDYLNEKPWYQLGMNLAIGWPANEQTDGWRAMYLPDQVHDQLAKSTIKLANGQIVPFVQSDQTLFAAQSVFRQQVPIFLDPDVVFTVLGVLIAVFTIRRYVVAGKVDRWLDRLLFAISGFLGWFLLLLWLIRDDGVTGWNPTLLYLMPLHLPLIYWATGANTTARRRTLYFGGAALLIVLGIFLSNIPGSFDVVFPLTLLIRCVVNMQPVREAYRTPARIDQ
ncbi:lipoprotein N-acyltransferase Lnb domain-containing protein [Spirosoma aerolatum]|uniref:lipoprotein N-acyltransferase Lnb domain-containing protein n=1 Tax=Spirosoma aerolatum TaxID=1211326 RepID=UPI0009ABD4D5